VTPPSVTLRVTPSPQGGKVRLRSKTGDRRQSIRGACKRAHTPPRMNASPPTDTQTDRTAPLALWRVAAAFMHILHALFGAPADVAARHTLRFEAHKLMASWLRAGEAMMRRLLLIEAAAHAKPNTRPLLRAPRKRTRKLMTFTPDAPEKWRVSFRAFHLPPRRGGSVERSETKGDAPKRVRLSREERWCSEYWPKPRFRSAWPLAERYEALLRVFNDPAAYARRLSRQLHATPHRAREVLRASSYAEHRIDHFEELTQIARTSAAHFDSS
jgi:hypothetical protein